MFNGELVATYKNDGKGVHFQLSDWLGTRRVQTDYSGNPELNCSGELLGTRSFARHYKITLPMPRNSISPTKKEMQKAA